MKTIRIGNKIIGKGQPCFIVAEAGINHNGRFELAKRLVAVAKSAGADAIKFQTFKAENLVRKSELQYEVLKRLELKFDDFARLKKYADKKDIIFLSTPFDKESADFLNDLKIPAFKIGSAELTCLPFLKYVAQKNKPIILSTGMSTLGEVKEAVRTIKETGNNQLILLHCTSTYPAKLKDCNLLALETLEKALDIPIGYSDHTLGATASMVAVALGAKVIEKHFTLDRALAGPDHKASVLPDELKNMIAHIRDVELALGSSIKRPTPPELEIRKTTKRSIVAKIDIPKGTKITEDMLDFKRPAIGAPPKYLKKIVGKVAKKDISKDEFIK